MLPFVVSQSNMKARAEDFTSKNYSLKNSLSHPMLLAWFVMLVLIPPLQTIVHLLKGVQVQQDHRKYCIEEKTFPTVPIKAQDPLAALPLF